MKQNEFIHSYIDKTAFKFNEALFTRSDDSIIEELKKIILSCERESFFTIKVKNFRVVEEYREINDILCKYQDYLQSKGSSNSRGEEDNRYNFIDLKSSDLKLLIVTYYIAIKDEHNTHDTIDVIIAVPRVVDKFYFRINGSYYSAMYQIVDASTYNNNTSKSAKHSVTLKTTFQPIRIFRNVIKGSDKKGLKTTSKEEVSCTVYDNNTFTKSVETCLYILAKMGYYGAMQFLGISNSIFLSEEDPNKPEDYYTFQPKKTNIFVNVPRMLFDGNLVIQHMVHTLCSNVNKDIVLSDMFSTDYWITCLGANFNLTNSYEKGISVLGSLEYIYDINTRDQIHLPWEYKKDVYCILRWMINEYNNLKLKNNLNIMTKKLRCAEYIASIYAAKLSKKIYWLSDQGKRADLASIRKVIVTNPMFLVTNMTRCQLINFRNIVTDMDSLLALKFTYKGISGIGETGSNAIPEIYKLLDISNMGVLDPDSSSSTDPGISGSIVPMLKIYGDGYFSEFQEPLTWENEYAKLYNSYKEAKGLTEILEFKKKVLDDTTVTDSDIAMAKESEEIIGQLSSIAVQNEQDSEYLGLPLEGSGLVTYE
jgi:hypothetical protein